MTATQTLSGGTAGTASKQSHLHRPGHAIALVRDAGSQHNDRVWERNDNNRRRPMVNKPENKA
jgi:hypothetical protein